MTDSTDLNVKLDEIGAKIGKAEERLKLKGLLHKDRKATADELSRRYQALSRELESEVTDLESHATRVGSFEKTVLNWVNSLNFDH